MIRHREERAALSGQSNASGGSTQPGREQHRWWGLAGAGAGALLGLVDTLFLMGLGVEMTVEGVGVTLWVGLFFTASFVGFGYTVGQLLETRRHLQRSAVVIADQLDALEASQARLIQSEKMASLGRLTAGVAHEVRNPLGVIRSAASMIMDDLDPRGDTYKAGEFIREEVDRLNAFVNALLDVSRPIAPRMAPVNLRRVAQSAHLLAHDMARTAEVTLVVEEEPRELTLVEADVNLMTQVVLGLMTNAIQSLEAYEEGTTPRVVVVRFHAWDNYGVLEVADNGPGVAPEDCVRIFEPFFTTRTDGTGLGLAMAKRVVEVHHGQLEA
ncbi:MAG: ATP-binding protein, partial [Myxococcota bacterium]